MANLMVGEGQHCNGLGSGRVESFLSLHAMDIRIFMLWPDRLLCPDADFFYLVCCLKLTCLFGSFLFQMFWLVLKPSSCLLAVVQSFYDFVLMVTG